MSTNLKGKSPIGIKRRIGKFFSKLSSKVSSSFSLTENTLEKGISSDASLFALSDSELTDPKKVPADLSSPQSNPSKQKQSDNSHSTGSSMRGSDSTMIFQQSSLEVFKELSSDRLCKINSNLLASDPLPDMRSDAHSHNSRFSSREASRFRLASIDEISNIPQLDLMNLQFNVVPLAIQPEKIERDNRAKRSKSAQSRKSLKSVPSLANVMMGEEEFSTQTSCANFDELSQSFSGSRSSHTPMLGPRELRTLMKTLKVEEIIQSKGSKSKKNKRLTWSDELSLERFRSLSDANSNARLETQTRVENDFFANSLPSSRFKETSSIFVQDREAIFVNRFGEKECSTTQINQYHLIREIGSGAFGTVYLSKSAQNGQYFALKMISKSRLSKKMRWKAMMNGPGQRDISEEMRREIAVLKKLSRHPNINYLVEVLDSAEDDNIYMIFELCEYGAVMKLEEHKIVKHYNENMARKMLRDVLLGLEYLHYKKIIHRDIKPENLLLSEDFSVVIGDFGISHTFENEEAAVNDTNASPAFSPPEAFNEKSGIPDGRAADVWSLGITLYALVHGRCPFESDDILTLAERIKHEEIRYSSIISPLLIDLMSAMLKKNPADRLTVAEIKVHPWVTLRGSDPMISTEENCIYEEVTDEEVKSAFKPAVKLVIRLIDSLRRRLSSKRRTDYD